MTLEREFQDAKTPDEITKAQSAGTGDFVPGSDKNLIVLGGSSRRL